MKVSNRGSYFIIAILAALAFGVVVWLTPGAGDVPSHGTGLTSEDLTPRSLGELRTVVIFGGVLVLAAAGLLGAFGAVVEDFRKGDDK